jgi:quercetin dioxygenase-like cupin family protein
MKITRISCMTEGASAFDEIEVELTEVGTLGSQSKPSAASSIVFRETPPDYDSCWHQAPHRQYFVLLDGEIEIECGVSEKRRFRGGDILLLEDTWGSGHRTRTTDGKTGRSLFIRLDA